MNQSQSSWAVVWVAAVAVSTAAATQPAPGTRSTDDEAALAERWNAGVLELGGQWIDPLENTAGDEAGDAYRQRRESTDDSVRGHLQMATYCKESDLPDRQRAHLLRAARLTPDHAQAAKLNRRAGDQRAGDVFVDPTEWRLMREDRTAVEAAASRWSDELTEIAERLARPDRRTREAAALRLQAVRGPGTAGLIAALFLDAPSAVARPVIETLSTRGSFEASQALAHFAVDHPARSIREDALAALRGRPPADYVPLWLDRLATPPEFQMSMPTDRNHSVDMITVEAERRHERVRAVYVSPCRVFGPRIYRARRFLGWTPQAVLHFNLYAKPFGNKTDVLKPTSTRVAHADIRVSTADAAARIQVINERVVAALEETQPVRFPDLRDVHDVWTWWAQANGVEPPARAAEKPIREYVEVSEQTTLVVSGETQLVYDASCFAAGTPVWTDAGPVAIEALQTGDRVLSRDVESGELSYKPVLRPTSRVAEQQFDLRLQTPDGSSQTLRSSGGHPLWQAGEGWRRVVHLGGGETLRTLRGTAELASREPVANVADGGRVYNLIVDQTHTYFVGDAAILVHDDTTPRPTDRTSPGGEQRP